MNIFHVSDQLPAVTKISSTIWTMDTIVGDTVKIALLILIKVKILLKFFYLVGTRKLEVIETITW